MALIPKLEKYCQNFAEPGIFILNVADPNPWYIYNNNRNRELNIVLTDCSTLKIVECFEFIFICSAGVELAFSPCTTTLLSLPGY